MYFSKIEEHCGASFTQSLPHSPSPTRNPHQHREQTVDFTPNTAETTTPRTATHPPSPPDLSQQALHPSRAHRSSLTSFSTPQQFLEDRIPNLKDRTNFS